MDISWHLHTNLLIICPDFPGFSKSFMISTRTIHGPSWCDWVSFVHLSLWRPLPASLNLFLKSHIIGRFLEGFAVELGFFLCWLFCCLVEKIQFERGFDRFWTVNYSGNLDVRKVWLSKWFRDDFHPSKSVKTSDGMGAQLDSLPWLMVAKKPPHQWATKYLRKSGSNDQLHSGKLTWQWTIPHLGWYLPRKPGIFHYYVSLPEDNSHQAIKWGKPAFRKKSKLFWGGIRRWPSCKSYWGSWQNTQWTTYHRSWNLLLMAEIRHSPVEVGSLSHYL